MDIAIVGAGRIGSTLAFHLAKAGHAVTVIARSKRLEELERAQAIVTVTDERAPVKVAAALDATTVWDLVIVTVFAHQAEAVFPQLAASRARLVLFAFNTFAPLDRFREAVGASRFAFAFPQMTALLIDGKLKSTVNGPGMMITLNNTFAAEILKGAKLPVTVEPDMESYLRSHAAFVIPLMLAANVAHTRKAGITWSEAFVFARAMREAFAVVKSLGNKITPGFVVALAYMPRLLFASLIWAMSRTASLRELGSFGPAEVRDLIDAVVEKAPDKTKTLRASRP